MKIQIRQWMSMRFDEQKSNVYTIEKNGARKLVYQTPWYKNGEMMALQNW
jgi:hypothetical protein